MDPENRGLTSQIGAVEIDWPQAVGYYSGIGLAVALGMVEPPLAIFIAAVPLFKMLNRPRASRPSRMIGQLLEGASKPVGGDGEASVRIIQDRTGSNGRRGGVLGRIGQETGSIWTDAKVVARGRS